MALGSAYLVEGSVIWVEGVALAPAVGACGMWKEEEDGGWVWITCVDRRVRAVIRLQRFYNFLLFHAIIYDVLDV